MATSDKLQTIKANEAAKLSTGVSVAGVIGFGFCWPVLHDLEFNKGDAYAVALLLLFVPAVGVAVRQALTARKLSEGLKVVPSAVNRATIASGVLALVVLVGGGYFLVTEIL